MVEEIEKSIKTNSAVNEAEQARKEDPHITKPEQEDYDEADEDGDEEEEEGDGSFFFYRYLLH